MIRNLKKLSFIKTTVDYHDVQEGTRFDPFESARSALLTPDQVLHANSGTFSSNFVRWQASPPANVFAVFTDTSRITEYLKTGGPSNRRLAPGKELMYDYIASTDDAL